jgi:hypothetical protein
VTWLEHFFGLDNLSGPFYGWWSGIGSDIGEVVIIGAIWQAYRARNCHVKGCWRMQWRKVPGTDHTVCRKHHPLDAPTHQDVLDDHRKVSA